MRKKVTVPISPKSHFKEKVAFKEEYVNKTNIKDRSFNTRVLQAPAALGKFSVALKSRSIAKKHFLGGQAAGMKVVKQQRRNTQFMEFDLSFRKTRQDGNGQQVTGPKQTPSFS